MLCFQQRPKPETFSYVLLVKMGLFSNIFLWQNKEQS